MQITIEQTKRILTENHYFSQLGFSMLLTRLKGIYAENPSEATLKECANEINLFLSKFQTIMTKDFSVIEKL